VPLVLSPFVLAELDYLLQTKVGSQEQLAFLHEVERGAYRLEHFSASDITEARKIMERYADLEVGLADASNLVLCNRHHTYAILTLDERHFRTVLSLDDRPLTILPADRLQRR
jgi:predicted nucleic acid-binding protein